MSGDRGAASVWVLGCCVLVVLAATVGSIRTLAVLARHRAEMAGDLAALAAAASFGTGRPPCGAARAVARENGARLATCHIRAGPDGRTGVAAVVVALRVSLPLVGGGAVRASARAERFPDSGRCAKIGLRSAFESRPASPHQPCGMLARVARGASEQASVPETAGRHPTGKVSAWRSRSGDPRAFRPWWWPSAGTSTSIPRRT